MELIISNHSLTKQHLARNEGFAWNVCVITWQIVLKWENVCKENLEYIVIVKSLYICNKSTIYEIKGSLHQYAWYHTFMANGGKLCMNASFPGKFGSDFISLILKGIK